jgi:hypothetical protein
MPRDAQDSPAGPLGASRALEAESGGRLVGRLQPTDATDVPAELQGVRTMFTALHLLPSDTAL